MKTLADELSVEEIRARLAAVRSDDVARWGTMSVSEMVVHLPEAFRVGVGGLRTETMKTPLPAGVVKWIALYGPMQWPHNIPTVPELTRGRVGVPGEFEAESERLHEALAGFLLVEENRTPHPIFGTMRPKDWMRWGYLHTDHHLRQFGR